MDFMHSDKSHLVDNILYYFLSQSFQQPAPFIITALDLHTESIYMHTDYSYGEPNPVGNICYMKS